MKKYSITAALVLAMTLAITPAFAADGTAKASTQNVEVDGKMVEFQMYALEDAGGGRTNYAKLRDVAYVLNGTKAQFSVDWDGSISISTGQPYVGNGTEMTTPYSGDRVYRTGSGAVKVNGSDAALNSIILTDDAGGDYTYFKLRDLGAALGFNVDWTAQRGVFIETGAETSVTPPASQSGVLANGKPITEDNVKALLAEVEKQYPTGTLWAESTVVGTAYNPNKVSGTVTQKFSKYHESTKYACGGFAAMVSDLVFGYDNPIREVTDLNDIRPGDIIFKMKNNTVQHIIIAADNAFINNNGSICVHAAEGNANSQVMWPTADNGNTTRLSTAYTWVVYTRYPD